MNEWTTTSFAPPVQPSSNQSGNGEQPDSAETRLKVLAASFKLLSDETRLRVLSLLLQSGELNVRSLCERLDQSQPAVSHHLALLRDAGIIRARRDGKHNYYRCIPDRLENLVDSSWRDVIGCVDQ